jgi:CBS domain-containing protein
MPPDAKTREETRARESSPRTRLEPLPPISEADLVNPLRTVAEVMTAGPRTCSPFSTVVEAVLIFRDADCGVVPVTEEEMPVGVLTDRDTALALADHDGDLSGTTVGEIMARDPVTISRDASLAEAVRSLADHGLRRLLVTDSSGHLVGLLSWTDLVPHVSERGLGWLVARIVENR